MSCEYESTCLNSSKCFRCYNQSLLKLKHEKRKSSSYKQSTKKDLRKQDSWKNLEQDVVNLINNVPTIQEARRSRASGAGIFKPLVPILVKVCPVCYYK